MSIEPFDDGRRIQLPRTQDGQIDIEAIPPADFALLMARLLEADRELALILANRFTPDGFTLER